MIEGARRQAIHEAIVRLSDGDRAAVGVLLEELWPLLVALARRGLGSAADAEDVAQEAFIRACARTAEFDRNRDGLAWVLGIAAFEVLTWRQRRARRREVSDSEVTLPRRDEAPAADEQLMQHEFDAALSEALAALPRADREALEPIAGLPVPAAARKRKQRALERLRALWRDIYGES